MISIVDETGWNDPKFYDKVTAAIRHVTGATTVVEQRKPAICKVVHWCPNHFVRSHGWYVKGSANNCDFVFVHCEGHHSKVTDFLKEQRQRGMAIIDYYPSGRSRASYDGSFVIGEHDDLRSALLQVVNQGGSHTISPVS